MYERFYFITVLIIFFDFRVYRLWKTCCVFVKTVDFHFN